MEGCELLGQGAEAKVWKSSFCGKPCVSGPLPSAAASRHRNSRRWAPRCASLTFLDAPEQQVVKERVEKRYRHPTLEASLSKRRLNQEARCILRARKNGVAAPCIFHIDYEAARIYMSFIVGTTLKEWLVRLPSAAEIDAQLKTVGKSLAGLHDADVVHGDLTSSNIMVCHEGNPSNVTREFLRLAQVPY